MKFSPKFRTKKLGMIYTILGSFCSFFIGKGPDVWSEIRLRKIPDKQALSYAAMIIFIFGCLLVILFLEIGEQLDGRINLYTDRQTESIRRNSIKGICDREYRYVF